MADYTGKTSQTTAEDLVVTNGANMQNTTMQGTTLIADGVDILGSNKSVIVTSNELRINVDPPHGDFMTRVILVGRTSTTAAASDIVVGGITIHNTALSGALNDVVTAFVDLAFHSTGVAYRVTYNRGSSLEHSVGFAAALTHTPGVPTEVKMTFVNSALFGMTDSTNP